MYKVFSTLVWFILCSNLLHAQQLVIDGNLEDWSKLAKSDQENKMNYDIRNDDTYLYIALHNNQIAEKFTTASGIEILLDSIKPTDQSLKLVFTFDYQYKKEPQFEKIKLLNFPGIQDTIVPLMNEFGVQAHAILDVANPSAPGTLYPENSQPFIKIEYAIPLTYLPIKDKKLQYSFCLKGFDVAKDGKPYQAHLAMLAKMNSRIQDNMHIAIMNLFTEHFGVYNLQ